MCAVKLRPLALIIIPLGRATRKGGQAGRRALSRSPHLFWSLTLMISILMGGEPSEIVIGPAGGKTEQPLYSLIVTVKQTERVTYGEESRRTEKDRKLLRS